MKKLYQIITFSFLLSVTTTSAALDLSEATKLAQEHDTILQVAYAKYLSTKETSSQNSSAILPQVNFNAFVQRGDSEIDKDGSAPEDFDNNKDGYSLNLNQVIYDKSIFENIDQGNSITAEALANFETEKQEAIIRIAEAYFDVLTGIDNLETAGAEKLAISKQLELSQERYNVGLSAITDVKEQQASYDISVADEIIAINELSNSRESLRVIINIYPEKLNIAKKEISLTIPKPHDINAWQDKALENNLALLSAKHAMHAAQSAYNASKANHYPTLNLNASYGVTNSEARDIGVPIPASENTDASVSLQLDIPIYSGGLTQSGARQKLADLDQKKALHEQIKRRTIAESRSAYLSLEAGIAQVHARKQAVNSTQSSLETTLAGYDAGTRTSVDVLISQRQLYSSQRDYSVARYAYLLDVLKLKRVAGILSFNDIEDINQWLIPNANTQTK